MPTYVTNRVFDPSTGMRPWVTVTSNYSAQIGDRIAADTSQDSFTITLPNNVSNFNEITIVDPNYLWGDRPLTIQPGGNLVEGLVQSLICDVAGLEIKLRYEGGFYGWRIYTNSGAGGGGAGGGVIISGGNVTGPAFFARQTSPQTLTGAAVTKINFDSVRFNIGNCYSTVTNEFKPNVPGIYIVTASVRADISSNTVVHIYLYKNNTQYAIGSFKQGPSGLEASHASTVVDFNGTTDFMHVGVFCGVTGNTLPQDPNNLPLTAGSWVTFSGSLINVTGNYVPPGSITTFSSNLVVPQGWLVCNGANVPINDYQALYNVIGLQYSNSPPSGFFTLPDLRGEFIRGWDGGRGIDTGRGFGSGQKGTAVSFNTARTDGQVHGMSAGANSATATNGIAAAEVGADFITNGNTVYAGVVANAIATSNINSGNWMITDDWGGGVSRPRNVALQYLIKY